MELEKYIKQKKSLSEEGFLKVMWGGSAKRGQDFDNRPPIWLDDASVLRHQLVINLKRTSLILMFGWSRAFQSLLVFRVDFAYKLIEAKPHQDIDW